MQSWESHNTQSAYPFTDSVATNNANLSRVVDAMFTGREFITAYLSDINTSTLQVTVRDVNGEILLSGPMSRVVHGTFSRLLCTDLARETVLSLLVLDGDEFDVSGASVEMAQATFNYASSSVTSFNGISNGDVTIKFDDTFTVNRVGDRIVVSRESIEHLADQLQVPQLTQSIYTINGTTPTPGGHFSMSPKDSGGCTRVSGSGHTISVDNICTPCKPCEEYYEAYVELQGLDDLVSGTIDEASNLMSAYNVLSEQLQAHSTREPADNPPISSSALTTRGFTGSTDVRASFNASLKFVPGSYGGVIQVTVTNGLSKRLNGVSVIMPVISDLDASPGYVSQSIISNSSEFSGLPGAYSHGSLEAHQSFTIYNNVTSHKLAGESVYLSLSVNGGDAGAIILGLIVPINAGLELDNPEEVPIDGWRGPHSIYTKELGWHVP